MRRVCIVGAGVAGAAAAYTVANTNTDVTVLESGTVVGGRAATRRREDVVYDYGANYVKDDDSRVADLLTGTLDTEGLVEITEPIWTFDATGRVTEGRSSDSHKWTYRRGISELADRILDPADVILELERTVDRITASGADWLLETTDGTEWGPYDAIVLTPPAPVSGRLLERAIWESEHRSTITDAIHAVPYRSIWTAVLGYPFELDVPYYGLVNPEKDHEIGWISREDCKPGHVPAGETVLIAQANHRWSVDHAGDDPDTIAATLARLTADIMDDDRLSQPDWTDGHYWKMALTEAGIPPDTVTLAERAGLYCAGDWVNGDARVHTALRSGLDVGMRLTAEL